MVLLIIIRLLKTVLGRHLGEVGGTHVVKYNNISGVAKRLTLNDLQVNPLC